MKLLPLLLTSCAILVTGFLLASERQRSRENLALESLEARWIVCREKIQQLVKNHPSVLEQLDQLTSHIKQAYLLGQGFIHKDIHRIIEAMIFSAEKHCFQFRKSMQTPYIIHPLGVADILITIGNVRDPDILIGALLHDTVEDTQTTLEEIEELFGERVAGFVQEVTDDKSLSKDMRKQLQIDHAADKSAGAAQIKLADKLYNLRDLLDAPPPDWDANRVQDYFRWAQAVVNHLPWVNAPLKRAVDEVIEMKLKEDRANE